MQTARAEESVVVPLISLLVLLLATTSLSAVDSTARRVLDKPNIKTKTLGSNRIEMDSASNDLMIYYELEGRPINVKFELATNIAVIVEASVNTSPDQSTLEYTYRIDTLRDGSQPLQQFFVQYSKYTLDVQSPEGWLAMAIPVGSPTMLGWTDVRKVSGKTKPGEEVTGLGFRAPVELTLPGVVTCLARGRTSVPMFPGEPPEEIRDALPSIFENAVAGKTVGPVPISLETSVSDLLGRMPQYITEASAEGWMVNPDVAKKYLDKISNIQKSIEKLAIPNTAVQSMAADILADVESDFVAGEITSEAHALLKYNLLSVDRRLKQ